MGVTRYVDNGDYFVQYSALYGVHFGKWALRSLLSETDGFLVPVDRPELSYRGQRFRLIQPLTVLEVVEHVSRVGKQQA